MEMDHLPVVASRPAAAFRTSRPTRPARVRRVADRSAGMAGPFRADRHVSSAVPRPKPAASPIHDPRAACFPRKQAPLQGGQRLAVPRPVTSRSCRFCRSRSCARVRRNYYRRSPGRQPDEAGERARFGAPRPRSPARGARLRVDEAHGSKLRFGRWLSRATELPPSRSQHGCALRAQRTKWIRHRLSLTRRLRALGRGSPVYATRGFGNRAHGSAESGDDAQTPTCLFPASIKSNVTDDDGIPARSAEPRQFRAPATCVGPILQGRPTPFARRVLAR